MSSTADKSVRVLLVDDSPLVLTVLKCILSDSPGIEVVGEAINGVEALQLIPRVKPDVIATDLNMPVMDGLQFTREVMSTNPIPILVISSAVRPEENEDNIFKLFEAGAVDVYPKPFGCTQAAFEVIQDELVGKLKVLAGVKVFTRHQSRQALSAQPLISESISAQPRMIAIGASTGGPQVLQDIFSALPASFPIPIVCVQHMSEGFMENLLEWLAASSKLSITHAVQGEKPLAGNIYFPPENKHLKMNGYGAFEISNDPPVHSCRPSVDTLFNSMASSFGSEVLAILLTGMGKDGAEGLLNIQKKGGVTVTQNEASCTVFGMPGEAIRLEAARHVLPPDAIISLLSEIGNLKARGAGI